MRRLDPWLPPLALMAAIFFFSAQESLDSGLGWVDTVARKLIHFAEYALLCALWWRALRTRVRRQAALIAAVAVASLYAASDEWHQSFVEGRTGSPIDWAIDTAGATAAALAIERGSRARRQPA